VKAHGLAVVPPPAWDVRVYRRRPDDGECTYPIMHAANFPLPQRRGDFGSGAVEIMHTTHVLVVLFEYEPAAAHDALFARRGLPTPHHEDFSPSALQRTLSGQSGVQYFFNDRGRAFCLYVVLGSHARRRRLVTVANQLLATLSISAHSHPLNAAVP
jgi:hypothetical protein